jgi:4-amino-4-deoxy-L-arabinose transferase-like glycosyltransferase
MFGMKIEEKRIRNILLIVEIVFLVTAMFSVIKYGNSLLLGSLQKFDNDDVKYIRSAWNLIDNGIISYENIKEPTVYIMPGLTVVLSCFMLVFGKLGGITAFRIFQVLLQGGSLYLIFLIGKKVFGERIALLACIINALYITELFVCNMILMECIFKFLLLLLILISLYAVEKKSLRLYACGGVVWAISCLFKPTIMIYPFVILIIWIKNKYKPSEVIKYSVVVLGIFCLVMLPWWVRNYQDFGTVIPLTKSSGNPFMQGTFINYDQSGGWGVPYSEGKNSLEKDQKEWNAGLKRLELYGLKQPVRYILWYTVGKTFYFWYNPFYWRNVFNISYQAVLIFHLLILVLGFMNIFSKAPKSLNGRFLILVILFFNLVYLPFFTFERYSYPVMPLIIIFAAAELDKMSKRKWKKRDGQEHSIGS